MKRDWVLTILQVLKWTLFADGLVFCLIAIGAAINTELFIHKSVMTTGTVTELEQHQDEDGSVAFSPVFTFATSTGHAVIVHSNSSSNPPGFDVGEKVSLRYVPSDPENARIATFWQTWPLAAGFGIGSVVSAAVGWFFAGRVNKRKARGPKLRKISSLNEI